MNKLKIAMGTLGLGILLSGCFGSDEAEIEKRELQRQIDMMESRMGLIASEAIEKTLVQEEEEEEALICGGLAGFLCPDGYVCLGKGEEAEATGVCVKEGEEEAWTQKQEEKRVGSVDAETCGVLGEKLNRNPLLGETGRECCPGLAEDRVSNSYAICRAATGGTEIVTEEEKVEVKAKIGEVCGGENRMECEAGTWCKTENDAPDAEGVCATLKAACAKEGEIPLDNLGGKCCAGLGIKDGVCTVNFGEYREEEETEITPVTTDWNVKGFARYETKNGGLAISYPQYWYYGGYGALEGSLWLAGFGNEIVGEDLENVVIKAKLMEGQSEGRTGNGWCAANLSSDRWVKVEGPESLGGILCQMADSAELVE